MTHLKNIYISILSTAVSLALLALAPDASAQSKRTIVLQPDTVPLLNGIEVSADIVGPAMKALGDYGKYEAALRINLKDKYFPIVELGYAMCDHTDDATNLWYKTNAPYAKIGCDMNMLKNKHDDYRLYVGLRYAFTSYKYDLECVGGIEDPVWEGVAEYVINAAKCKYHWAEAVFGVQAKMFGPVHLGWSVRYCKRLIHDEGEIGKSWQVPGFGKSDGTSFNATFNVILAI